MYDFQYYTPTKVYFGKNADSDVGSVLKEYAPKKVMIHFGGGSAKKSGLIDKIEKSLDAAGIDYIEFGGVQPNPKLEKVREGVALCKKEGVDFILAVGGGSVIDSSKCIGCSLANDADPWDIITKNVPLKNRFPVGVVLTLSAAGSEMSNSQVITNLEIPAKRGRNDDAVRPVVAFMNPENTYTVSKYQTGCGIVDIMMHTFERFFQQDEDVDLTNRIAEAIMVAVRDAGKVAIENPRDYNARATIMWASSLSHNGLTQCGKNFKGMAGHALEHGISGNFDNVAHGAGLAVVYPALLQYIYKCDIPKFCEFAVRIWGVEMNYCHPEKTAFEGIMAMKEYFRSIGMPVTMSEIGVPPEAYEKIANTITSNGTAPVASTYIPLGNKEIIEIFKLAE